MIHLDLNNPEFQAHLLVLAKFGSPGRSEGRSGNLVSGSASSLSPLGSLGPDRPSGEVFQRLLNTLHLRNLTWPQISSSKGLRWELIQSRPPQEQQLYSLRISRGCRAVAWRDGDWLRLAVASPRP